MKYDHVISADRDSGGRAETKSGIELVKVRIEKKEWDEIRAGQETGRLVSVDLKDAEGVWFTGYALTTTVGGDEPGSESWRLTLADRAQLDERSA